MAMTESGCRGDAVYLRGWDDYEHHTLKLQPHLFDYGLQDSMLCKVALINHPCALE
jgi:hypothetical protein